MEQEAGRVRGSDAIGVGGFWHRMRVRKVCSQGRFADVGSAEEGDGDGRWYPGGGGEDHRDDGEALKGWSRDRCVEMRLWGGCNFRQRGVFLAVILVVVVFAIAQRTD